MQELWSERQARLRAEAECDHLCDDYDALERRFQESQNRLAIVEAHQGCAGQPQGEAQVKGCRVQPLQHDTCSTAVANNLGKLQSFQCMCIVSSEAEKAYMS